MSVWKTGSLMPKFTRWVNRIHEFHCDDVPAPAMLRFAALMRAAGSPIRAAVYPGGHNWRLWRHHFSPMLRYASRVLGRPRVELVS